MRMILPIASGRHAILVCHCIMICPCRCHYCWQQWLIPCLLLDTMHCYSTAPYVSAALTGVYSFCAPSSSGINLTAYNSAVMYCLRFGLSNRAMQSQTAVSGAMIDSTSSLLYVECLSRKISVKRCRQDCTGAAVMVRFSVYFGFRFGIGRR